MSSSIDKLLANALLAREAFINRFLDPRRDIAHECGHLHALALGDYERMWRRGDVAARAISIYPEETWSQRPEVFETEDEKITEFEQAWKDLNERLSILSHLQRVDTLSGIGRFGILLLGIDDGKTLDKPIDGVEEMIKNPEEPIPAIGEPHKLLYLRPLDETVVEVKTMESSTAHPRYGLPLTYNVKFTSEGMNNIIGVTTVDQIVHWSRVIHVADNRTNSEVFGTPRLQQVFDRLMDLRKIAGGSAEMFWKGAFPGLSMESHPNIAEDVEFDKEATKAQMEAYMNGLQRYIATIGMEVKSLTVQIADPRPHVEVQMRLIATALGVPWRIFMGSEAAQLASEQDVGTWNRRLTRRREDYVNSFLLRPFVDRLLAIKALPAPAQRYQIWWPDLNTPSNVDKATVAEKQTNALSKYVASGVSTLLPPYHYFTLILGMDSSEASAIIQAAGGQDALEQAAAQALAAKQKLALPSRGVVPANNGA